MKKLNFLFLCLLSVFLLNCSRDNDSTAKVDYEIYGTWMPTSITLNGTISQNGISQKVNQTVPFGNCERQTRITFNANETGNIIAYSSESGSCEKKQENSFTYVFNKTTGEMTMNINNVLGKSKIIKATEKELVSEEYVKDQNVNGITFTGTAITTYQKVK